MRNIKKLLGVMKTLRSKEGCPWDREQTHESILSHMIEEAYETQEAALQEDWGHFKEELGDLLFQVVFHAQIASEAGRFDFEDVCEGIAKKLVHRHPHVFKKSKKTKVKNADQVMKNWEQLKLEEKKAEKNKATLLGDMPKALPSLWKAYRMGQKASRVGFEFPDQSQAWDKVKEEIGEFEQELKKKNKNDLEMEFGDILFSLVNVARFLKINPEMALQKTNLKFQKRFSKIEKTVHEQGKQITDLTIDQLDVLWNAAKNSKDKKAVKKGNRHERNSRH